MRKSEQNRRFGFWIEDFRLQISDSEIKISHFGESKYFGIPTSAF